MSKGEFKIEHDIHWALFRDAGILRGWEYLGTYDTEAKAVAAMRSLSTPKVSVKYYDKNGNEDLCW